MSRGGEAPKRNRGGEGDSELSQPFNVARRFGQRLGRSVPPMTLILRSMAHVGRLGHDAGSAGATSLVTRRTPVPLELVSTWPDNIYIYANLSQNILKPDQSKSKRRRY